MFFLDFNWHFLIIKAIYITIWSNPYYPKQQLTFKYIISTFMYWFGLSFWQDESCPAYVWQWCLLNLNFNWYLNSYKHYHTLEAYRTPPMQMQLTHGRCQAYHSLSLWQFSLTLICLRSFSPAVYNELTIFRNISCTIVWLDNYQAFEKWTTICVACTCLITLSQPVQFISDK